MPWRMFEDLWTSDPMWPKYAPYKTRQSVRRAYPAINVYGNDERLILTSEIPGLKSDEMDITVHGKSLTIKGSRNKVDLEEGDSFMTSERGSGEFSRTLTLPYEIEAEKIEAAYDNGVLKINLPRVERDKPRKISISAG